MAGSGMIKKVAWFLIGVGVGLAAHGDFLVAAIFWMAGGVWGIWGSLREYRQSSDV